MALPMCKWSVAQSGIVLAEVSTLCVRHFLPCCEEDGFWQSALFAASEAPTIPVHTFSGRNSDAATSEAIVEDSESGASALKTFSTLVSQLHRLTTQTYDDAEVLLQDFVETGCEIFGLPTGIVSRIEADTYTVRAVHDDTGQLEPGAQFDLEDTYCHWVVQEECVVAHATAEAALGHPAYIEPALAAYISAPIWVDGAIYGTLNFSSVEARDHRFAPEERDILEVMARSIGQFLEHSSAQEARRRAEDQLKRSEALLQQTNQMAQVGGWEYVPATGRLYWTEEVYHLHDLPLDHEPQMEEAIRYYAPEARPLITEAVQLAIEEGVPYDLELPFVTAKGNERWIRAMGKPVAGEEGETRLVGAFQDITERRCASEALSRSRERLHLALSGASLGLWDWNITDGTVVFNEQWAAMLDYSLEDIEPHVDTWVELVHPDDLPRVTEALQEHLEGRSPLYETTHRMRAQDGSWRWILDRGKVVDRDAEGKPLRATGIHQDVTERKEAQYRLRQLKQEYEAVFENAQDALFFVDVHPTEDGPRFTYARLNPNHQEQTGLSEEEVRGKTPREVLGDELGATVESRYRRCVEEGATIEYEETLPLPAGTRMWHTKLSPVIFEGAVTHIVGIARDVTKQKVLQNQLHHQAHHDPLTDLPNRKQFFRRCQDAIDAYSAHDTSYAVLFLDLDRFKNINDSLGHQAGDTLLTAAARRIRERLREGDFVGRLGGDEFGFILQPAGRPENVEQVAMRISEAIEEPFQLEGQEIRIEASIGIVMGDDRHRCPEDLLREADMAMYRAKAQGDRCTFFDPNLGEHIRTQFFLEADLHRALQEDELRVFYQPVVNMADGSLTGFEALVRWQHPERGLLAPGAFIEVAEKTGLVVDLDRWMIRATCRQAQAWQAQTEEDLDLLFHVNCSHRTFIDAPLAEYVDHVLGETGLPPTQLALEITERMIVEDTDAVAREMGAFKDQRVRLCIDDFGVKYSSLGVLHELPVDALKVDRKFVQQIDGPEANDGFVRAIADLAHGMGLALVAEGIETSRQLEVTRDLGYQLGQGFLMAHPMDVDAASACIGGDQPWRRYWAAPSAAPTP